MNPEFRAWDKHTQIEEGEYINGAGMFYPQEILFNSREVVVKRYNSDSAHSLDFDDIELMQFIGLKDKNRKKIFEGDIVKCKLFANQRALIGEVKYAEKSATFYLLANNKSFRLFSGRDDLEVLGNIFENPELLKEEIWILNKN